MTFFPIQNGVVQTTPLNASSTTNNLFFSNFVYNVAGVTNLVLGIQACQNTSFPSVNFTGCVNSTVPLTIPACLPNQPVLTNIQAQGVTTASNCYPASGTRTMTLTFTQTLSAAPNTGITFFSVLIRAPLTSPLVNITAPLASATTASGVMTLSDTDVAAGTVTIGLLSCSPTGLSSPSGATCAYSSNTISVGVCPVAPPASTLTVETTIPAQSVVPAINCYQATCTTPAFSTSVATCTALTTLSNTFTLKWVQTQPPPSVFYQIGYTGTQYNSPSTTQTNVNGAGTIANPFFVSFTLAGVSASITFTLSTCTPSACTNTSITTSQCPETTNNFLLGRPPAQFPPVAAPTNPFANFFGVSNLGNTGTQANLCPGAAAGSRVICPMQISAWTHFNCFNPAGETLAVSWVLAGRTSVTYQLATVTTGQPIVYTPLTLGSGTNTTFSPGFYLGDGVQAVTTAFANSILAPNPASLAADTLAFYTPVALSGTALRSFAIQACTTVGAQQVCSVSTVASSIGPCSGYPSTALGGTSTGATTIGSGLQIPQALTNGNQLSGGPFATSSLPNVAAFPSGAVLPSVYSAARASLGLQNCWAKVTAVGTDTTPINAFVWRNTVAGTTVASHWILTQTAALTAGTVTPYVPATSFIAATNTFSTYVAMTAAATSGAITVPAAGGAAAPQVTTDGTNFFGYFGVSSAAANADVLTGSVRSCTAVTGSNGFLCSDTAVQTLTQCNQLSTRITSTLVLGSTTASTALGSHTYISRSATGGYNCFNPAGDTITVFWQDSNAGSYTAAAPVTYFILFASAASTLLNTAPFATIYSFQPTAVQVVPLAGTAGTAANPYSATITIPATATSNAVLIGVRACIPAPVDSNGAGGTSCVDIANTGAADQSAPDMDGNPSIPTTSGYFISPCTLGVTAAYASPAISYPNHDAIGAATANVLTLITNPFGTSSPYQYTHNNVIGTPAAGTLNSCYRQGAASNPTLRWTVTASPTALDIANTNSAITITGSGITASGQPRVYGGAAAAGAGAAPRSTWSVANNPVTGTNTYTNGYTGDVAALDATNAIPGAIRIGAGVTGTVTVQLSVCYAGKATVAGSAPTTAASGGVAWPPDTSIGDGISCINLSVLNLTPCPGIPAAPVFSRTAAILNANPLVSTATKPIFSCSTAGFDSGTVGAATDPFSFSWSWSGTVAANTKFALQGNTRAVITISTAGAITNPTISCNAGGAVTSTHGCVGFQQYQTITATLNNGVFTGTGSTTTTLQNSASATLVRQNSMTFQILACVVDPVFGDICAASAAATEIIASCPAVVTTLPTALGATSNPLSTSGAGRIASGAAGGATAVAQADVVPPALTSSTNPLLVNCYAPGANSFTYSVAAAAAKQEPANIAAAKVTLCSYLYTGTLNVPGNLASPPTCTSTTLSNTATNPVASTGSSVTTIGIQTCSLISETTPYTAGVTTFGTYVNVGAITCGITFNTIPACPSTGLPTLQMQYTLLVRLNAAGGWFFNAADKTGDNLPTASTAGAVTNAAPGASQQVFFTQSASTGTVSHNYVRFTSGATIETYLTTTPSVISNCQDCVYSVMNAGNVPAAPLSALVPGAVPATTSGSVSAIACVQQTGTGATLTAWTCVQSNTIGFGITDIATAASQPAPPASTTPQVPIAGCFTPGQNATIQMTLTNAPQANAATGNAFFMTLLSPTGTAAAALQAGVAGSAPFRARVFSATYAPSTGFTTDQVVAGAVTIPSAYAGATAVSALGLACFTSTPLSLSPAVGTVGSSSFSPQTITGACRGTGADAAAPTGVAMTLCSSGRRLKMI
jgi:hypothetical protein